MNDQRSASNGECLSEESLTDYLEGVLSPIVKNACESHLAVCDPCRENLALFMKILSEDVTPQEEVVLQKLSQMPERQGVRPAPATVQRNSKRVLVYVVAAVAALLILALGLGGLPFGGTPPAREITNALLAQIRPFEPRIAGQPYRAVEEVTRGPENTARFEALEAEMANRAAQAYEMGQLCLIEKKYPNAIKYLRIAAGDSNATADVHNDLGVAYLQSGEETFGLAEAAFKTALNRNPNHASAVFNLSILYEREGLSGQAEKRWRQYIQLDPESGWAQEIKRKLAREEAVHP